MTCESHSALDSLANNLFDNHLNYIVLHRPMQDRTLQRLFTGLAEHILSAPNDWKLIGDDLLALSINDMMSPCSLPRVASKTSNAATDQWQTQHSHNSIMSYVRLWAFTAQRPSLVSNMKDIICTPQRGTNIMVELRASNTYYKDTSESKREEFRIVRPV